MDVSRNAFVMLKPEPGISERLWGAKRGPGPSLRVQVNGLMERIGREGGVAAARQSGRKSVRELPDKLVAVLCEYGRDLVKHSTHSSVRNRDELANVLKNLKTTLADMDGLKTGLYKEVASLSDAIKSSETLRFAFDIQRLAASVNDRLKTFFERSKEISTLKPLESEKMMSVSAPLRMIYGVNETAKLSRRINKEISEIKVSPLVYTALSKEATVMGPDEENKVIGEKKLSSLIESLCRKARQCVEAGKPAELERILDNLEILIGESRQREISLSDVSFRLLHAVLYDCVRLDLRTRGQHEKEIVRLSGMISSLSDGEAIIFEKDGGRQRLTPVNGRSNIGQALINAMTDMTWILSTKSLWKGKHREGVVRHYANILCCISALGGPGGLKDELKSTGQLQEVQAAYGNLMDAIKNKTTEKSRLLPVIYDRLKYFSGLPDDKAPVKKKENAWPIETSRLFGLLRQLKQDQFTYGPKLKTHLKALKEAVIRQKEAPVTPGTGYFFQSLWKALDDLYFGMRGILFSEKDACVTLIKDIRRLFPENMPQLVLTDMVPEAKREGANGVVPTQLTGKDGNGEFLLSLPHSYTPDNRKTGEEKEQFGSGTFGVVEPGFLTNTTQANAAQEKTLVAVKKVPSVRPSVPGLAQREILFNRFLADLDRIPEFLGAVRTKGNFTEKTSMGGIKKTYEKHIMVFEAVLGTELMDVLKLVSEYGDVRNPDYIAFMKYAFREFCLYVKTLHDRGIIHRDLKPENVLVGFDGKVRGADLGLAVFFWEDAETLTQVVGSPPYLPKERIPSLDQNEDRISSSLASDIMSLGFVLYELMSGLDEMAYGNTMGKRPLEFLQFIYKYERGEEPEDKGSFQHLVWAMTASNPEDRISIDEVLSHDFLATGPIMSPDEASDYMKTLFPEKYARFQPYFSGKDT